MSRVVAVVFVVTALMGARWIERRFAVERLEAELDRKRTVLVAPEVGTRVEVAERPAPDPPRPRETMTEADPHVSEPLARRAHSRPGPLATETVAPDEPSGNVLHSFVLPPTPEAPVAVGTILTPARRRARLRGSQRNAWLDEGETLDGWEVVYIRNARVLLERLRPCPRQLWQSVSGVR